MDLIPLLIAEKASLPIKLSLDAIIFQKYANKSFFAVGKPNENFQQKTEMEEELSGLKQDPDSLLYLEQFFFEDASAFTSKTVA